MRVHRLSLTAFGPFPDTAVVDLDEVGRDGLFLLWGPTGAGKTTLLDAVVFALYGTVPGARGEEKRLRSHHAVEAVRTEVECEVTLSGERLLVTRRPEQQRPKKRGAGWTTEQARLVVQRWTGTTWEPVSTRIDEGSEHLRRRLGLSAEQFCQVVLLPQGDFARFLRAEPDDRARLLRTLFDVDRFARAEEWLAEQRRAADEELRKLRSEMSALLARVAQVADVTVPEELAPELVGVSSGARVDAWLAGVRTEAAARLEGAAATAAAAGLRVAGQDADLAAARALDQRHARRKSARRELDRAIEAEEAVATLRAELDAGRRAEVLRDVLESAGGSASAAEQAAGVLEEAGHRWAEVAAGRIASAPGARELRDELAELRALLPDVERAEHLGDRVDELHRQVAGLQQRCTDLAAAVAGWPDRVLTQEGLVRTAEGAAARLPGLVAARAARGAAVEAAQAAERLTVQVESGRRSVEAAREAWVDAREDRVDLMAQRLAGMAAELAAQLSDGGECAVCGATEHPRPATHTGPVVTVEAERAAAALVDQAESRLSAARAEFSQLTEQLAARRAQAGDEPLADQLRALTAAQHAERTAAAEAGSLDEVGAQLTAMLAARDEATTQLSAAREEWERRRTERASVVEALQAMTGRLDAARGTDPDLPGRIRRLTLAAERCDALLGAQADELRARTAADATRLAAERRAVDAGFPDVVVASFAFRTAARLAELSRQVEEHDRARAVAVAVLAEPDLADLPPWPDLGALQEACAAATAAREDAVAALEYARRCATGVDRLTGDLTAAEVELDERRSWAQHISELADLVNGRGANALRMRLQSFVLAARLEQVAEVASRRLQDMSAGRYTFLHSDAQGRHGARGGLGLDVFDEHTGVRRPTKTLSGGESFMASLALALGLADVVTAESGGVQIDTLFVDEGFGSLDPQALDAVMTVLDELRRGGRTVGLVSHVEELRTRIPSRLEVVAGRHGSRLAG